MNYFIALVSFSVGLYTLQLLLGVLRSNFRIMENSFGNFCSCFLFLTFPFVNFANAADILFFQSYVFTYLCGAYGFLFMAFSFLLPREKTNEMA